MHSTRHTHTTRITCTPAFALLAVGVHTLVFALVFSFMRKNFAAYY